MSKNSMSNIRLSTLQDILAVADDGDFEQLIVELPNMLRSMRAHAKIDGHAGFRWPITWRSTGGASTITSHFSDGSSVKRQL